MVIKYHNLVFIDQQSLTKIQFFFLLTTEWFGSENSQFSALLLHLSIDDGGKNTEQEVKTTKDGIATP